jgi:ketosteroid isomerase-like protein
MDEPAATLALAKELIDRLERRDAEGVIALLHEDVVLELPFPILPGENATGTRRQAGPAVHAYVRHSKELTARNVFTNVVWRSTTDGLAVFQSDGDCTLADGRPYRNHYLFLFEAKDGKIVRWVEYMNPVTAARAFGAPLDAIP